MRNLDLVSCSPFQETFTFPVVFARFARAIPNIRHPISSGAG